MTRVIYSKLYRIVLKLITLLLFKIHSQLVHCVSTFQYYVNDFSKSLIDPFFNV